MNSAPAELLHPLTMQRFSHRFAAAALPAPKRRIGADADPFPADPRHSNPKKTPAFTPASEYLSCPPYGFAKKKPPYQT
jgi:hypothetical protein